MGKSRLLLMSFLCLALIGATAWLYAQPKVARPNATATESTSNSRPAAPQAPVTRSITSTASSTVSPPNIQQVSVIPTQLTVGAPTSVLVTAIITNPSLLTGSVNLLRFGATGTQPAILGVMHDDGLNGDVVAGDGTVSLQITFNEASVGEVQLGVSAAFKGGLRRIIVPAPVMTVFGLGSPLTFTTPFYQFRYPSNYTPTESLVITDHRLSPGGIDLYGLSSVTLQDTDSGAVLDITVQSNSNDGQLPSTILQAVQNALQTNSRPSDVLTNFPVNGKPALESIRLLANNEAGYRSGSREVVIVGTELTITLTMDWTDPATNDLNSQIHQDFNTIVQSLSFQ